MATMIFGIAAIALAVVGYHQANTKSNDKPCAIFPWIISSGALGMLLCGGLL